MAARCWDVEKDRRCREPPPPVSRPRRPAGASADGASGPHAREPALQCQSCFYGAPVEQIVVPGAGDPIRVLSWLQRLRHLSTFPGSGTTRPARMAIRAAGSITANPAAPAHDRMECTMKFQPDVHRKELGITLVLLRVYPQAMLNTSTGYQAGANSTLALGARR